ncbi:hypothetical protein GJ744_003225 [Endocarpon pusillum]|uniref:N-acetyltransferase domain-containing protein n=1 Tax=Endocarpon pusillum TaxID=364733 RepID=A0A8H7A726_9EURO|nr:hypothetical protein GJ744_003225 [Endocarpon pusillum]
MPLKLLTAEPGDIPRIVQLEEEAFADSPLTPILFPDGKSQDIQDAYVENLLQQWQDNSASRTIKVIDTDLNDKIIAFARWYIFIGDDVRFIKMDPDERHNILGSNEAAGNEFFGGLLKIRARIMGRNPHCFLSTLCTDPQHQRRGAGTMLIQWGCDIAQKHGVPSFLEATPAGLSVYQRCGFEEVDRFVFNLEKYGGEGSRVNVQMIKYPETASKIVPE